jgi:Ca2+-binding EF-hand superfamily protein
LSSELVKTVPTLDDAADADIDNWKRLYDIVDMDGNGHLDSHELGLFLCEIGVAERDTVRDQIHDLFEKYDDDKNGTIEIDEFLNMMTDFYFKSQAEKKLAEMLEYYEEKVRITNEKSQRLQWKIQFDLCSGM